MLPATHRPILEHVLDALIDAGIQNLNLIVGYKRDRIQEHFGPTYRNHTLNYITQEKQLGTGHALLAARDAISEDFLVVNGDQIIDTNIITDVRDAHTNATDEPVATLGVLSHADVSEYGAIVMEDSEVVELIEKPQEGGYRLLNAGVYAFSDTIFAAIDDTPRTSGELALTDTLRDLISAETPVRGVRTDGLWIDATYPWDLLEVARELLYDGSPTLPEQSPSVWVADSATVPDDAVLQPPVIVGPDCEIQPSAVVGPRTVLGQNVTVGANATIQDSLIDRDTRVGAGSTLLEGVTGQEVHVGPNSTIPGGPGDVTVSDTIHTGKRLAGLLADRVHLDGSVSVAPGTMVGPRAHLHSSSTVSGTIAADAEVYH